MLKITCHGAVGEIGGNKILLEDSGSGLMLDFGKSFSGESAYFDEFLQPRTNSALRDLLTLGLLPPIEGIYRHDLLHHGGAWAELADELPESARRFYEYDLPSYQDYCETNPPRIDGVLLSHAHGDHVQHISFLDPRISIYCSAASHAILQAVQDTGQGGYESDILCCPLRRMGQSGNSSTFPGERKLEKDASAPPRIVREVQPFESMRVGGFVIEAVPVDHSVPGACSFLITSPSGKTIFYTGDVRFHGRYSTPPQDLTAGLRSRTKGLAPDVVITEGTRIDSDSSDCESDVERAITEAIAGCRGLAIVDFGWKDTTRFQTVLSAAQAAGRTLAVNPKVAYLWNLLRKADPDSFADVAWSESVKVYTKRMDSQTYSRGDYSKSKHIAGLDADWGSKGANLRDQPDSCENPYLCHYYGGVRAYDIAADPTKYVLHAGFFDMNELLDVNPPAGSIFIKAATEPFSDEMELDEAKLANWLKKFGMMSAGEKERITRHHVSGHASGADLLDFITDMSPARVIPIHTENPDHFRTSLQTTTEVIVPVLGQSITIG